MQLSRQALAFLTAGHQCADDRRDHAEGTNKDWVQQQGFGVAGVEDLARAIDEHAWGQQRNKHDWGNNRTGIGLEQVGAHTGHVADVVAHGVSNGGWVARVVFGNTSFDLADEVAADVSRLGEDATADAGEQGDRACAETECGNHLEGVVDTHPGHPQQVVEGDTEQRQASNGEAHDGATLEGQRQRLGGTFAGCVCGAGVGRGGDTHTNEACNGAEHRAHEIGKRCRRAAIDWNHEEQYEHDRHEDGHPLVLTAQERHGTFTDGLTDLFHELGAFVGGHDHLCEVESQC